MSRQGTQIALSLSVGGGGLPHSPPLVRSVPFRWFDRLATSGQGLSVYQELGVPLARRGDAGTIFAYPLSICGSIIGKGSFH